MTIEQIEKLLTGNGLAVGLLVIGLLFAWRLLSWLKPYCEKFFSTHIDATERNTKAIETIADSQVQMGSAFTLFTKDREAVGQNVRRSIRIGLLKAEMLQHIADHLQCGEKIKPLLNQIKSELRSHENTDDA